MLYILALSQAPIVLIFSYIYARDTHEREPLRLLLWCFLGGILCLVPAVFLEWLVLGSPEALMSEGAPPSPFRNSLEMFLGVALIEEACKLGVVLLFAYRKRAFSEPFDGIVYTVAVSLGFAAIENLLYVVQFGIGAGWLRMFSAVPLHALAGILMGFYLGQAKFHQSPARRQMLIFIGLVVAVIGHGAYDYFVSLGRADYVPLAAFVLVTQAFLAHRAMRIYNSQPPLHEGTSCVFLPHEERSLLINPIDLSIICLRLLLALGLFWGCVNFAGAVNPNLLDLPPTEAAYAALLGFAGCMVNYVALRGLKRRSSRAWNLALGLFVLGLPTPVFVISIAGLTGLLHPSSRLEFAAPMPLRSEAA